jgi:hypothetical protein
MRTEIRLFVIVLVLFASVSGLASALFQQSTFQAPPSSFQSYYPSSDWQTYWPSLAFDNGTCKSRQDLLLQVAPGGCQPMVVRSDLLAEQNVPVFCQIMGLQVNPLIDLKQIRNIRFSGTYPSTVAGVGFHPAEAALKTSDTLTGSPNPFFNNLGYVVVILKRNPNEKNMSDFVNLTLTAQVEYNSGNALGIGKSSFMLKEMTDDEWESVRVNGLNSFWNGKYSIRLENADENSASVSLYEGNVRTSTVRIDKNKPAGPVYLPDSYCMANLQLYYDGFQIDSTRAIIEVSSDKGIEKVAAFKGSTFLDGQCRVGSITSSGSGFGKVEVVCQNRKFTLERSARIFDYIVGQEVNVKVNDKDVEGKRGIIASVLGNGKYGVKGWDTENPDKTQTFDSKSISPVVQAGSESIVISDTPYSKSDYRPEFFTKELPVLEKKFNDTMAAYEKVVNDFPHEQLQGTESGQKALEDAIVLASSYGKMKKQYELMSKYIELYPNAANTEIYKAQLGNLVNVDSSKGSYAISINNLFDVITLKAIEEPKEEDKSTANLIVGANRNSIKEGGKIEFSGSQNRKGTIVLNKVNVQNAILVYSCVNVKGLAEVSDQSITINTGESKSLCGVSVKLESVDVKTLAQIRIVPNAEGTETTTNLTVRIGIEKRNIKLSDDQKKDMIKNLNDSIAKWEGISEKLGKVVTGLKTTCLATSLILTFKNLMTGLSGETVARQNVMEGWRAKCKQLVETEKKYRTLSECYQDPVNSGQISSDVAATKDAIKTVNDQIGTLEKDITKTSLLGDGSVNTDEAKKRLAQYLRDNYGSRDVKLPEGQKWQTFDPQTGKVSGEAGSVDVNTLLADENLKDVTYAEMRNIYLNLEEQKMSGLSDTQQTAVSKSLVDSAGRVGTNRNFDLVMLQNQAAQQKNAGLPQAFLAGAANQQKIIADVTPSTALKDKGAPLTTDYVSSVVVPGSMIKTPKGDVPVPQGTYVLGLQKQTAAGGDVYGVQEVYKYDTITGQYSKLPEGVSPEAFRTTFGIGSITPTQQVSYSNKMVNPQLRFFETEPYKGMPAIVPFDTNKGWYAATKQTLPSFGGIGAFDSSGRVVSFSVCNVGTNGRIEFGEGYGDDICEVVNMNTGQALDKFPGLPDADAKDVIQRAMSAIQQAANKYGSGAKVEINDKKAGKQTFDVGSPMTNTPETDCEQFMSPSDCSLLFNLCDPVVCPASRCDFGGTFHVPDVIQSGIIGSAVLCLPNFGSPTRGKVLIPVCLSGINAGIDAWVSVLKGHRDCLQESLDKGTVNGICDQLYSFYSCDFFWRQIGPMLNTLIPNLLSRLVGNAQPRGGGEYATTQAAWANADKSMKYLTNTYGFSALKSFQIGSVSELGSAVCKGYVSATGPTSLKNLLKPDSPPQFSAWFDSTIFSSATLPATAQYKVFYHIFAGKGDTSSNTAGVYYSVYLKNPPESGYYSMNPTVQVASGFISAGQYAEATKDFTAPDGYKDLCVRINADERCGFKQVSTSMAVNYLADSYVSGQLNATGIISEKECISGTPSAGALLANTNPQSAAEEALLPDIYNRGIIRICSTQNPGATTDPTRFVNKGYCDDPKIGCWLDTQSVKNAVTPYNTGLINQTLSDLKKQTANLDGYPVLNSSESTAEIKNIGDAIDKVDASDAAAIKVIFDRIDLVYNKVSLNSQKAQLLLEKALLYRKIFEEEQSLSQDYIIDSSTPVEKGQGQNPLTTPAPEVTPINPAANLVVAGAANALTLTSAYNAGDKIYLKQGINTLPVYVQGTYLYAEQEGAPSEVGRVLNGQISVEDYIVVDRVMGQGYANAINGATLTTGETTVNLAQGNSLPAQPATPRVGGAVAPAAPEIAASVDAKLAAYSTAKQGYDVVAQKEEALTPSSSRTQADIDAFHSLTEEIKSLAEEFVTTDNQKDKVDFAGQILGKYREARTVLVRLGGSTTEIDNAINTLEDYINAYVIASKVVSVTLPKNPTIQQVADAYGIYPADVFNSFQGDASGYMTLSYLVSWIYGFVGIVTGDVTLTVTQQTGGTSCIMAGTVSLPSDANLLVVLKVLDTDKNMLISPEEVAVYWQNICAGKITPVTGGIVPTPIQTNEQIRENLRTAAQSAVGAYVSAPITTLAEISKARILGKSATNAVSALQVEDSDLRNALSFSIAKQTAMVDSAEYDLTILANNRAKIVFSFYNGLLGSGNQEFRFVNGKWNYIEYDMWYNKYTYPVTQEYTGNTGSARYKKDLPLINDLKGKTYEAGLGVLITYVQKDWGGWSNAAIETSNVNVDHYGTFIIKADSKQTIYLNYASSGTAWWCSSKEELGTNIPWSSIDDGCADASATNKNLKLSNINTAILNMLKNYPNDPNKGYALLFDLNFNS